MEQIRAKNGKYNLTKLEVVWIWDHSMVKSKYINRKVYYWIKLVIGQNFQ